MLSFNRVACRREGALLFSGVNLVIHAQQKVGLVGANGSGKSSLIAMIRGELEPDDGELALQQQLIVAHVAQETPASAQTALDYVIDGDQRVRSLESAIAESEIDATAGEQHATLLAEFEQAGGYRVKSRAGALLNGLGFSPAQHNNPVAQFSGGWRMRLNLAQALMCPSDLLLLDEPTNHLDLDAVLWLEQWLRQADTTLLLISHDREFLDRVTSHTLHIENRQITLYPGNYSAFEALRASRMANQSAMFEKQQQKAAAMQQFVDRFRAKATKAKQAQSRLKMLERLTLAAPAHIDSPFRFQFREPDALPSPLVTLRDAEIGYDSTTVLRRVRIDVQSGDRLGLLGPNGAGKSTLIKTLVGDLPLQQGQRLPAQKLKIGYFAQHQVDQLRDDFSPLQSMLSIYPTTTDSQARDYLGGFGFSFDRALQTAKTLSGGERARLALALIVYSRPNLLLLDEPTNHLDIDMRQALAEALQDFSGALIVISHDRTLLRSAVDSLWLVADAQVQPFNDDLDGYARWLSNQRDNLDNSKQHDTSTFSNASSEQPQAVDRKQRKRDAAVRRELLRPLRKQVEQHARELERYTADLAQLRSRLASNELYNANNKSTLTELLSEQADGVRQLDAAEEQLLESMLALEQAEIETNGQLKDDLE